MHWSQAVDLYCERTDASFWAEPVNAVSNVAFLIAAAVAFWQYRARDTHDWPVAALIALTAVVGVGSFIFHTTATQGTALFDVVPIAVFIYSYLLFALRRYLGLSRALSIALLVGFAALTFAEAALVPREALNGSHAYLLALAATFVVGLLVRGAAGKLILAAGVTFAVSLVFRTIDNAVCAAFPLGTHFIWHCLNALLLYLLLRAALIDRAVAKGALGKN
jgi:Ceramidase